MRSVLVILSSLMTLTATAQEPHTAVAATEPFDFSGPFVYAFGWHTESGNQAGQVAIAECNRRSGGKTCWTIGTPGARGSCTALTLATWQYEGMERPQNRLLSADTTLGRLEAENEAISICEAHVTSGIRSEGIIDWRCDVQRTFCPEDTEKRVLEIHETARPIRTQNDLPVGITYDSTCASDPENTPCWQQIDNLPDCYIWNELYVTTVVGVTWSGQCSGGFANGTGMANWFIRETGRTFTNYGLGPFVNGKRHGTHVRRDTVSVTETPFVDGERHGVQIFRWEDGSGRTDEVPWVNDVKHGQSVSRNADGEVIWSECSQNGTVVASGQGLEGVCLR